jgi:hypothetical protein
MGTSPRTWWIAAVLAAATSATGAVAPAGRDLHDHWDTRCASCHGDAGDFARSTLRVEGGRLVGTHHVDTLPRFLRNHYLGPELLDAMTAMLTAQATTPPVFKTKCRECHDKASVLARESLALKDGVLVGKDSGRPVADLLRRHGHLAADEIAPMVSTLQRVLAEVGGAAP